MTNKALARCGRFATGLFAFGLLAGQSSAQMPEIWPHESSFVDESTWEEQNPMNEAQPRGALTGASIFVNPGHGWFWTGDRWTTQRGLSYGIIEDHSNAEAVMQNLVPYLWNAGARVYTARERCMNTNMVIVEAGGEGWSAEGDWEQEDGFGMFNHDQIAVKATTEESPTAISRFVPEIPEDGYYGVYAWYSPSISGPTSKKTSMTINHTGGTTVWTQNQNHDGRTWKYIGEYYFEKGADLESGSVIVDNRGEDPDSFVTIDAIRFGGGIDKTIRGGAPSNKPRWEVSGRYYVTFKGYDPRWDSRTFGTVGAMPMWAEWEMESWEKGKSVYVGWHTNAGSGKSRGLFSFIYGPNPWDPPTSFTGYTGGIELCITVHDQIIEAVHGQFDPEWRDGAKVTRWLGETNPRNNNKMPAALFEYGFHDNPEDAAYILDPNFRRTVSKGTYQGLVKFYAENMEGFDNSTFLPEPPVGLAVVQSDEGVRVSWDAPPSGEPGLGDPATRYIVQKSKNGKGFDNGVPTENMAYTFTDIQPGETMFFRVAAENAGGRSFPSETLGVRIHEGAPRVLVVNGFDRMDRGLNLDENGNERGILRKMNSYDYIIQHGKALESAGIAFDSSSDESVTSGTVPLANYDAVVWMLGQEKGETVLDEKEREALSEYFEGGGSLFLSGSEVAESLSEISPSFLNGKLGVRLAKNQPKVYSVSGASEGAFGGLGNFEFSSDRSGVYPVQSPDHLEPMESGDRALVYTGGNSAAAITSENGYRVVFLGFPFETIMAEEARNDVMKRAMEYLLTDTDQVALGQ